MFKVFLETTHS